VDSSAQHIVGNYLENGVQKSLSKNVVNQFQRTHSFYPGSVCV
jgi:hypothetical protein